MIHKTLNFGTWRSQEAELSVLGDVTGRRGVADWSKFDRKFSFFVPNFREGEKTIFS